MKTWAPDRDTALFLSASSMPSHFGVTLYNGLFRELGLNYLYLARRATDAAPLVAAIRALEVRGCSVSMPLKSRVVEFMDGLDEAAQAVGSVNTILNDQGQLRGFNTDIYGFRAALPPNLERVLVYGSGSVTNAVLYVLRELGARVLMTARTPEKCRALCARWGAELYAGQPYDLLVNATPMSQAPLESPVAALLARSARILDLVVSPQENYLERWCRAHERPYVSGFTMYKHQFVRQFLLYTGQGIAPDVVETAARRSGLIPA